MKDKKWILIGVLAVLLVLWLPTLTPTKTRIIDSKAVVLDVQVNETEPTKFCWQVPCPNATHCYNETNQFGEMFERCYTNMVYCYECEELKQPQKEGEEN